MEEVHQQYNTITELYLPVQEEVEEVLQEMTHPETIIHGMHSEEQEETEQEKLEKAVETEQMFFPVQEEQGSTVTVAEEVQEEDLTL